jgi:hypothetical protein
MLVAFAGKSRKRHRGIRRLRERGRRKHAAGSGLRVKANDHGAPLKYGLVFLQNRALGRAFLAFLPPQAADFATVVNFLETSGVSLSLLNSPDKALLVELTVILDSQVLRNLSNPS